MTRKRNDGHSTEFGLWLREQHEIDSALGFVTTNLDYIWENYKTGKWMYIEEKRHGCTPTFSQAKQFVHVDKCVLDENYCGFYVLIFENTSPDDGRIWLYGINHRLDRREITREQLLAFLRDFRLEGQA